MSDEPIHDTFAAYHRVKTEYASVQHLLTTEQRQHFRRRIAQLATSSAQEVAPRIAAAAEPKQNFFETLAGAFKLRG